MAFEQVEALGELSVRWTGGDRPVKLEIDEYAGTPAAPPKTDEEPDAAEEPAAAESSADGREEQG